MHFDDSKFKNRNTVLKETEKNFIDSNGKRKIKQCVMNIKKQKLKKDQVKFIRR